MRSANIKEWLAAEGLAQYVELFEQNRIELDVLPDLTERDLHDLSIPLGDRKRILKAIQSSVQPQLIEDKTAPPPSTQAPEAERRQLTVMFCDLVGSTRLAAKLDPEPLRELMHAYQQTCGKVIERYQGHVAQYLGDGLMVYFGWPRAHEDDAERAVRSALEIVDAVKSVSTAATLHARVGIATGAVVVGETGGGDASVPKAAVGETPNLAARLQALAQADEIVIAPSTYRLLGAAFEYADLGEHTLKGIVEPVQAWKVTGVSQAEGRFEAARPHALTPFVGREHEIGLLLERWQQACEGEGQVVLLSGEPGIGKSRITQVLRERLTTQPHTRLRYQCSPYHTSSAFYPIINQFERAAGFERDDSPRVRLDKMEAALAVHPQELPSVALLIASLLSLPIERYPPRMLSPQKQKELTMAAFADQALHLARKQPLLMVFEDAHWIDPSSLETFGLIVERIRQAATLLLVTSRPEFVSPWGAHAHVTSLSLNRLSRRHGAAIVQKVTEGKALPGQVLEQILAKTDGVPLFVEELTKTVLEAGFLKDTGERYVLEGSLPPLAIPSTLRDSLMARLDRLSPVKEVAQIGACIGREFSYELLSAISPLPQAELDQALEQLAASELIFRRGSPPEATYSFKHALVQDSAYESLLYSRRQQVHSDTARALESGFPDLVKTQPELLALHLTKAGLIDVAVPQWLAAARAAARSSRYREALSHVDSGLSIVGGAAPNRRVDLEAALLVAGGASHVALTGYASEAAATLYTRAEALLDRVSDADVLESALWGIGVGAWVAADFPKALATLERLAAQAEQSGDIDRLVLAYSALGGLLCRVPQFDRGRRLLEFVVQNYNAERHSRLTYATIDPKQMACDYVGLICVFSGYPSLALAYMRTGVAHAKAIGHPLGLAQALSVGTGVLAEIGDCEEALEFHSQCAELCQAQGLPFWGTWATIYAGAAAVRQERYADAELLLERGWESMAATGARNGQGYVRAWRSLALAHLGRYDEARQEAETARERCMSTGEMMSLPFAAHARGVTELLDPRAVPGAAEQWFQTAIFEARSQGDRLIELRAANSLAGLWHSQGRSDEARALVTPIYGWFKEGFDTKDLKDAKALLDQLA
jgi:class 3 adenylate cyclase/tetratricopeptide (TPR) repeat protein